MKWFYDCEFIEDGKTIDLISLGLVSEEGDEWFYAINEAIFIDGYLHDRISAEPWLMENVIPQIMPVEKWDAGEIPDWDSAPVMTLANIKVGLTSMLWSGTRDNAFPELWGWYSTYDHMVLNQLFGRMMDKPDWMPWITHDIASYAKKFSVEAMLPNAPERQHNALVDAYWHREMFLELRDRVKRMYGVQL